MELEGTPRSERAAETRERILNAATELMAAKGYAGTSVTELCEKAHIVRPVLYFHFGSKEGLLGAVVEHVGNAIIDEIASFNRGTDPAADPPERLRRGLAHYRELILDRPERLRLLLLITLELGDRSPEVRKAMRRYQRRAVETVAATIEEVVGIPLPNLDMLGVTVIGMLQNALIRRVFDPEGDYFERLWDELAQTVRLGVIYRIKQVRASEESSQ